MSKRIVLSKGNNNDDEHHSSSLRYRTERGNGVFEWSRTPLPELTSEEINELSKLNLGIRTARHIKQLMLQQYRYKEILNHFRGKKGFSVSNISKIHAALMRAKKKIKNENETTRR